LGGVEAQLKRSLLSTTSHWFELAASIGDQGPDAATHRRNTRPNTSSKKHMKASIMKFVSPDTSLKGYSKRRSAFLKELIASTPNVSARAKEFRRWIDENSPYGDNDEA
jgi:hypothetical protein